MPTRDYQPRPTPRPVRGFTLIELMVTLAVVAVLVGIAYPNLQSFIYSQRLSAATNELIAGLQIARSEAVRRNARVALCRSTDGATCAGSSGTWTGWVVMADSNGDGTPDELVRAGTFPTSLKVTDNGITSDTVLFRPDGIARESATDPTLMGKVITVCIAKKRPNQNQRLVAINSGSLISTSSGGNGAGTCP